jgi:hypothetical protein
MTLAASLRSTLVLAILSAPLVGCGGSGGREEGPPTAPVVSAENQDQLAKDVNAGAGSLGKGAPGVNKK